ncbi:hypothetical protein CV770_27930 [Bradyrhizobium sp. AC87j1]|nr:hypothetical protein CV770_27930 [Bradyrhizobium sp. AC87j1]
MIPLPEETGQSIVIGRSSFWEARQSSCWCPATTTRSREDRHANARRPLVGSGSVAAAARVEPSPEGLAQAHTAERVQKLERLLLREGYLHRRKYVLRIARKIRVDPIDAARRSDKVPTHQTPAVGSFESKADLPPHAVAIKTGAIAS